MKKMKKRIRSVNFTLQETELLVSFVESRIDVIESKKCDAIAWQEKEHAWKCIESDFNSSISYGEVFRDAKCLKLKFDSLKRDIRKKERLILYDRCNLGNLSSRHQFTELEKKVKDMIVPSVETQDQECLSDSDQAADVKNFSFEVPPIDNNEDIPAEEEHFEINEVQYEEFEEKPFQTEHFLIPDDSGGDVTEKGPATKVKTDYKHPSRLQSTSGVSSKPYSSIFKSKLKKRRQADEKLSEAKLELIQQEIKKEIVQTKLLQQEYEHKRQVQELEKQHLLLKIQLTKIELESAKKNKNIEIVE